jgi:nickel-dependent lactate racemase
MIFPGVAGYDEIQSNHRKVLQMGSGSPSPHPGCEPGVLDGNPVAEDIARAADLLPPALCLCLVEGRNGGVAAAVAGPWRAAFTSAVDMVRGWYETRIPARFGLAVASGGGAPFDGNLIQAHKGLDAACRFLADGGELLYVADLSGGSGSPDMDRFLDRPTPDEILRRLERGWVQYGHTTLRLVSKTSRFRVHLVSRLDPELARRLGFHPVDDPAEVIESWRRTRAGETAAVLAGPPVYPMRT